MNETYNNLISYSPAPEALRRDPGSTADSPTDYGNVNGAGVVSVLKSGTNQFHGSAYGYVQDYRFDANSYAHGYRRPSNKPVIHLPSSAAPSAGPSCTTSYSSLAITWDRAITWAGSDHRKRDYGRHAERRFLGSARRLQSHPALRPAEQFRALCRQQGRPDHQSGSQVPLCQSNALPGLRRRQSRHSQQRQVRTPSDGIADNNYQAPNPSYKGNNQGDVKIEYDPRAKDKITGFYSISTPMTDRRRCWPSPSRASICIPPGSRAPTGYTPSRRHWSIRRVSDLRAPIGIRASRCDTTGLFGTAAMPRSESLPQPEV